MTDAADTTPNARGLADTQASLRRLAMLIAQGAAPDEVFAAVTKEVLRHFGSGTARMVRYEFDGTATLLANEGTSGPHVRVGEAWEDYPSTGLTATVRRTGRAARVETYSEIAGGDRYLQEGLSSAVGMPIHVDGRLWGLIAVGSGIEPLPPDTEHRMTEFTDLIATAIATAQSRIELMASRARLVAASDEVRRRIERDLHDGAQQRLIGLALRLRTAADRFGENNGMHAEIAAVADEVLSVIDDLRELCGGIHPAILSTAGLGPALRTLGRRSAVPTQVDVQVEDRLPGPVEVAAYYVVSEGLANAAKHADASVVQVGVRTVGDALHVRVHDDGVGGADPTRGSGLIGLSDRVETIGGKLFVQSLAGGGTTVWCEIPTTTPGVDPMLGGAPHR